MAPTILFVDPSCPFAWITSRWLAEVEQVRGIELAIGLVSLSVVNEGRELEPWYREFNDRAWGPARVAAAVADEFGGEGLRRYYEAFGEQVHMLGHKDFARAVPAAIDRAGLPPRLAVAAGEGCWDDGLRAWTERALSPVGADVGTPVIHVGGTAFFGPVLTAAPRGESAGELYDSMLALLAQPAFVEFKRGWSGELQTT